MKDEPPNLLHFSFIACYGFFFSMESSKAWLFISHGMKLGSLALRFKTLDSLASTSYFNGPPIQSTSPSLGT